MGNKVGILGVQGLPASYGAFEQTTDQIVRLALKDEGCDFEFYVACTSAVAAKDYDLDLQRVVSTRFAGGGVILYGLLSFLKMYAKGVRSFVVFGYAISPFFMLFEFLGCKVVCNVDGFEWRRRKWGRSAKNYFKFCEFCAAKSKALLVFDSRVITRYYSIIHKRSGLTLFYGADSHELVSKEEMRFELPKRYFVVVMRLEPENNIKEIVEGFANCNSDRGLVIVGPSTRYFEDSVKPLVDTDDRINWIGPVYDRALLYSIRSTAEVYIHGHSVGGTNPTLVEACEIGRPVIAYKTFFNREVLGDKAKYFKDSASLTSILNESATLESAPKLGPEYTWEFIARAYLSAAQ